MVVRSNEIFVKDEFDEYLFKFNKMVYSIDDYAKFMKETGLFDLLENHLINNLYDYVLGVEVGLDSNGRKKLWWTFDGRFSRKLYHKSWI